MAFHRALARCRKVVRWTRWGAMAGINDGIDAGRMASGGASLLGREAAVVGNVGAQVRPQMWRHWAVQLAYGRIAG